MGEKDSAYGGILQRFKDEEKPEAVLVVADEAALAKIVVAWPTISVERKPRGLKPPSGDENALWEWLWKNTRYCVCEVAERTGIRGESLKRKIQMLIGNRVLYPDGTINSFVQRYLREKVLKLFSATSRKTSRAK